MVAATAALASAGPRGARPPRDQAGGNGNSAALRRSCLPKVNTIVLMRNPRDFFKPLAIDAPEPAREIPFKPSRMIHFLDFSNEKMVAKVPDIAPTVDILLGNLEDAVPVDRKL